MRDLGFTYEVAAGIPDSEPLTRGAIPAFVAQLSQADPPPVDDPNKRLVSSMEEDELVAYLDALSGPFDETTSERSGGCFDRAEEKVSAVRRERYAASWLPAAHERMANDDRVVAANEAWRACVRAKGFSVSDEAFPIAGAAGANISAAAADAFVEAPEADPTAIAVDIECAQENVWNVWYEVENELLAEVGEQ